jgi:hypothetical protein
LQVPTQVSAAAMQNDCAQLLAHHFIQALWQIGDVEISRAIISLRLESRIERFLQGISQRPHRERSQNEKCMIESYPGKANLVTKAVESSNAQFRVANVIELGKPKSTSCQYQRNGGERSLERVKPTPYKLQC